MSKDILNNNLVKLSKVRSLRLTCVCKNEWFASVAWEGSCIRRAYGKTPIEAVEKLEKLLIR